LRFILIDKIIDAKPGESIRAIKTLSLGEEYLGDHFPGYPVMPGVMMTEAMVEAASWLVRITEGFKHSMVTLKEARNVKYGRFISPGDCLTIEAIALRFDGNAASFKISGTLDGQPVLSGRFILDIFNLADTNPALEENDRQILASMKKRFEMLASDKVRALVGDK